MMGKSQREVSGTILRRDLAVFQKHRLEVLSAHAWKAIFLDPCRQSGHQAWEQKRLSPEFPGASHDLLDDVHDIR
jgi:hypothetical protein